MLYYSLKYVLPLKDEWLGKVLGSNYFSKSQSCALFVPDPANSMLIYAVFYIVSKRSDFYVKFKAGKWGTPELHDLN